MSDLDTLAWVWRIEQGEREAITVPVLDEDDDPFPIDGWVVDAEIKDRPGGATLYTWPDEFAFIFASSFVRLIVPAAVSEAWTWSTGWMRLIVRNPSSDPADPVVQRILQAWVVIATD